MNSRQIWDRVLDYIKPKVTGEVIETWFRPMGFEGIDGVQAKISVPNAFFGEWMGRNYRDLLKEAFASTQSLGTLEVSFIVKKDGEGLQDQDVRPKSSLSEKGRGRRGTLPNPKYTFKNFVVGASNQFAHAASRAVAESPARAYNPLFIFGGVGLGKTHLLHAIGNFALEGGELRIAYLTTEQFTNEVINSIRFDKMVELRKKYRNVDMLLIDDIQFLEGKERTQEEFFHTFNALYEAHRQIVLTSDRFPKEMPSVEDRLRSRFEWGLIADLQQPDVETRIAIVRKKSEDEGLVIDEGVVQLLAGNLKNNIREIEGALTRLGAYSQLTGHAITVERAKTVLRDLIVEQRRVVTCADIQGVVANRFHVRVADLKSKRRTKTLVQPRQVAMYLCRELTEASYPEIGREFGDKDHTTVIHACKQVQKLLESDPTLTASLESLRKEIGQE